MAKNLRTINEQKFIGYNDRVPEELVPKEYLADLLNGFSTGESIEKRKGYSLVGDDLGSTAPQGIEGVEFSSGTKELIIVWNGSVYKWTGSGNWSLISGGSGVLATTGYVDIVVANDNVYFFDGTNTVPKYDGSSVTTVGAIPKGTMGLWFHNFLFVAGVTSTPNTLHVSTVNDPEAGYGASDNIEVNPNDGDKITALNVLKDELMVFKRNRIWSVTGFGPSQFTLSDLNERISGYGTNAHRSVVSTGNDLFYMSFLGEKPHIRSLQRTRYGTTIDGGVMSFDIEGTMDGLNKSALDVSAGIFDGRRVRIAVANGASSTNSLEVVYDTILKGWARTTGINASEYTSFTISNTPQIYFTEASADGKSYVFDTSTDDNGAAIDFQVKSRRYGVENSTRKKKYKYLFVVATESGDWELDVDHNVDGFTYTDLDEINLGTQGATFDSIVLDTSRLGSTDMNTHRIEIPKITSFYYQLLFQNGNSAEDVTIRSWHLQYLYKGPRDAPN